MVGKYIGHWAGNIPTVDTTRKGVVTLSLVFLSILAVTVTVDARQREYLIGPSINVVGGGDNAPAAAAGFTRDRQLQYFYGVFPSLTLVSTRATSSFNASYAFGTQWTETSPRSRSDSHSGAISLTQALTRRWNVTLSDSFALTSDITSFNAFRGVTPPPEDVLYLFDPVAFDLLTRTNRVAISLAYALSPRSTISFNGEHNLRTFEGDLFRGDLSDQQAASAGFSFSRQTRARETWSFGFASGANFYQDFDDSNSHTAFLGYSNEIAADLFFDVTGGVSRVDGRASGDYVGFNTSVRLSKTLENELFSIFYNQATGQQGGLGSTSDTRSVGATMDRAFGGASLLMSVSGFETRGTLDNPHDNRGVSAVMTVGFPLAETVSVEGGGQFQRYTTASAFGFTQRRIFVSLNFSDPDLWRFIR